MGDFSPVSGGGLSAPSLEGDASPDISPDSNPAPQSGGENKELSDAGMETLAAAAGASLTNPGTDPSFDFQPDEGGNSTSIEHIGTLNVGDQYASSAQNSPETAGAVSSSIAGTASLSFSVSGPQGPQGVEAASPPTENTSEEPVPREKSPSEAAGGSFSFFRNRSSNRHEEERLRMLLAMGLIASPAYSQNSTAPISPTSPETNPVGGDEGAQRFIFEVYDVHEMGGDPSTLSIRDEETGDIMSSFELPEGNSQITADLPQGNYSLEVQSGNRSGDSTSSQPDNLDNFRVEAYSAGPSSSSGSSPSPGSSDT